MTQHVEGLSHLLLQVSDLLDAEHFYCGLLGLSVKSRETFSGGRPLIVTHQGMGITLLPSVPPTPAPTENRNLEHVAFWVKDIDQLAEILRSEDIQIDGPKPSSYGQSMYVLDPDGNRVECIERK